jgi:uncharacterized membrane protein YczE
MDFVGIAMVGLGSALYITCALGPGPRDGLMTSLHHRSGIRVGRVRLGIEATVLILGALLGGTVGLGTALFALFIAQKALNGSQIIVCSLKPSNFTNPDPFPFG